MGRHATLRENQHEQTETKIAKAENAQAETVQPGAPLPTTAPNVCKRDRIPGDGRGRCQFCRKFFAKVKAHEAKCHLFKMSLTESEATTS